MNIAFATSAAYPEMTDDDRIAAEACAARGIRVTPAVWDDPGIAWSTYRAVVIRSTWDYHRRPGEFRQWLARLDDDGVQVWNPTALLRWNADKRYLRELASRGVATVPTAWLGATHSPRAPTHASLEPTHASRAPTHSPPGPTHSPVASSSLGDIMDAHGWRDVVVKPAISATAHRTHRASRADADRVEAILRSETTTDELLVQPYLPEIETAGEWSLMFFAGAFSHSVRKRPRRGDFRVQAEFGGTSVAEPASPHVVETGAVILHSVDGPWLYARIDGLETENGFILMELEMLEPTLFFALAPAAAPAFAAALNDVCVRSAAHG